MTYDFAYPEQVMYLTDVVSYLEVDIVSREVKVVIFYTKPNNITDVGSSPNTDLKC